MSKLYDVSINTIKVNPSFGGFYEVTGLGVSSTTPKPKTFDRSLGLLIHMYDTACGAGIVLSVALATDKKIKPTISVVGKFTKEFPTVWEIIHRIIKEEVESWSNGQPSREPHIFKALGDMGFEGKSIPPEELELPWFGERVS